MGSEARKVLHRGAALVGCSIIAALVIWLVVEHQRSTMVLSDGSVISIDAVFYGRTNVFLDGTLMEKALATWLPTNGINLLGKRLRKPAEQKVSRPSADALILRLGLSTTNQTGNLLFQANGRMDGLITLMSQSGHRYAWYCEPWQRSRDPKRWYTYVHFTAFPREQHRLALDVLDPNGNSVAVLKFKNPVHRVAKNSWPVPPSASTNIAGIEVNFGRVRFPAPSSPLVFGQPPRAILPVTIRANDRIVTNWTLTGVRTRDAASNFLVGSGIKLRGTSTQEYAMWPYLDPATAWLMSFHVTQDSGFESNDLCTVSFEYPLTAQRRKDFGDYALDYRCPNRLIANLSPTNSGVRLTFVDAYDASGRAIIATSPGNWGQHHFDRSLAYLPGDNGTGARQAMPDGTKVTVVFAIHTNFNGAVLLPP